MKLSIGLIVFMILAITVLITPLIMVYLMEASW